MNLVNAFDLVPESVVLTFWAVVLFGLAGGLRRAVAARFVAQSHVVGSHALRGGGLVRQDYSPLLARSKGDVSLILSDSAYPSPDAGLPRLPGSQGTRDDQTKKSRSDRISGIRLLFWESRAALRR